MGLAIKGVVEENTSWHPTPYVYRTIVEMQRIYCEKSSTVTVIVAVSVTPNVVESGRNLCFGGLKFPAGNRNGPS